MVCKFVVFDTTFAVFHLHGLKNKYMPCCSAGKATICSSTTSDYMGAYRSAALAKEPLTVLMLMSGDLPARLVTPLCPLTPRPDI